MASKKTLVFLISVTVALLVISYFLIQQDKKEGFQVQQYNVNNLNINTCPTFAPEIQTAKGYTDCCQGDMVDGKCNGNTFCTKSPSHDGIPICVDVWRSYFSKKGTEICPATMPNYYEDVMHSSAKKGCSAAAITVDGKMPKDGSAKQCRIYPSELDNKTKGDSCYLEKERSKIQCPVVNGKSPAAMMLLDPNTKKFLMFSCQYPFELGIPDRCYEGKSFYAYMDTIQKNWRTNKLSSDDVNKQICTNYISRRNAARDELNRIEAERRAREAAEAKMKALQSKFNSFMSMFNKNKQDTSRLQQQLDEANRKAQQCKK